MTFTPERKAEIVAKLDELRAEDRAHWIYAYTTLEHHIEYGDLERAREFCAIFNEWHDSFNPRRLPPSAVG